MGILGSQSLEKLEEYLGRMPDSWYSPRTSQEYVDMLSTTGRTYTSSKPILCKPTPQQKEEIKTNAKKIIEKYTSMIRSTDNYRPKPSSLAAFALHLACIMSGVPMNESEVVSTTGIKDFRQLFNKLERRAIYYKIIKKDPTTGSYSFIEDEIKPIEYSLN
jgi:hypothetical protein